MPERGPTMSRRGWLATLFPAFLAIAAGCGSGSSSSIYQKTSGGGPQAGAPAPNGQAAARAKQVEGGEAVKGGGKPAQPGDEPISRKIIYSASVEVVVKDLEAT